MLDDKHEPVADNNIAVLVPKVPLNLVADNIVHKLMVNMLAKLDDAKNQGLNGILILAHVTIAAILENVLIEAEAQNVFHFVDDEMIMVESRSKWYPYH